MSMAFLSRRLDEENRENGGSEATKSPFGKETKIMKSRGASWQNEWAYFINPKTGKIQYNALCLGCIRECKQSHKCEVVTCRDYEKKAVQIK